MDGKQHFLKLLYKVKRELVWEHIVKQIQFFLLFLSALIVSIYLVARFFVVMNLVIYISIGVCVLLVIYLYRHTKTLPTIHQAARLYDQYAKEDRTSTALSFIHETDSIHKLQRQDALTFMKKSETQLKNRKRKFLYPIPLSFACIFFTITILFIAFPNEKMLDAKDKESEIKVVKEIKKELKEKAKEQKNELAKKSIDDVLEQLTNKKKAEDALKELMKQYNELELKKIQSEQQNALASQAIDLLKNANMESLAKAIEVRDKSLIKKELDNLIENLPQLSEEEKAVLAEILGEGSELSQEQLIALEEKLLDMIDNIAELNNLSIAQNQILNSTISLQQMMSDIGLKPSDDVNQLLADGNQQQNSNGSNPSNDPSTNPSGSNPGSNQGTGNQPGSSNSPGSGSGSGPGNGPGNSPGSGIGSGSTGGGLGSGAGKGMGSRELTIPETADGKINIEQDLGEIGKGNPTEQQEGYGPILKGAVRPYEQVYNQYEKVSRESVERMHLPTELEDIVKDYFSKIKPD